MTILIWFSDADQSRTDETDFFTASFSQVFYTSSSYDCIGEYLRGHLWSADNDLYGRSGMNLSV